MYPSEYMILVLRIYAHIYETNIMSMKELLPIMGIVRTTFYDWKNIYYSDPLYKHAIFNIVNDKKFNNKKINNNKKRINRYADNGDEIIGDKIIGDELIGDELIGDELIGDELIGDELIGDEIIGNELIEDKIIGDPVITLKNLPKRVFNKSCFSKKVTDECINYIISHTLEKKVINTNFIKKYIKKHFSISITANYIYALLKKHKITYKKAQKNTYLYNTNKLTNDKERLKNEILNVDYDLNYTDEMSVCCGLKPDYGWSKSGEDCIIDQPKTYCGRGYFRHSCVMTITKDKIINYRLKKGSFNGKSYFNYMRNTINKMGSTIPFMDNAKIHKSLELKEYLNDHDKYIIFNVPYSPKFNPIEFVFNTLKEKIRRAMITNVSSLRRFIRKFVNEVNEVGLKGYCDKARFNLFSS